jgi:hypothetical protein
MVALETRVECSAKKAMTALVGRLVAMSFLSNHPQPRRIFLGTSVAQDRSPSHRQDNRPASNDEKERDCSASC